MIAAISAALIVLLMMVAPGDSKAACAWVLWATAPDASFHTPIAGWEDQRACTRDMKKRNLEPEQPGQKRAVYFCLPDTVDPRGPKGRAMIRGFSCPSSAAAESARNDG